MQQSADSRQSFQLESPFDKLRASRGLSTRKSGTTRGRGETARRGFQLAEGNWQQAGKRYPVDRIIAACHELSAVSCMLTPCPMLHALCLLKSAITEALRVR